MKFLPDSAILGTLGHIKHASKPKRVKSSRRVNTRSQFVGGGDTRTLEQLLVEARKHAEKAGK